MDKRLTEAVSVAQTVIRALGGVMVLARGYDRENTGHRSRRTGEISKPNFEYDFFEWKKA